MARTRRSGGGFGKVLLGFVLGAIVIGGAGFAYLKFNKNKMPAVDKPVLVRKHSPSPTISKPRIEGELKKPPFGISEDVFEGGAQVYKGRCASCHGTPGRDAALAGKLNPPSAQLWKAGRASRPPGEIYGKVANGIPGGVMPAYRQILSETAMWQVSLLLANADKPLPEPVRRILGKP